MTTTPNQPDRERRKVEDRAREMLAQLIGNDYSDTTLRVAADWLKQERRIAFRDADRAGEGAQPPPSYKGYVDAFYEIAKMMGISACSDSPVNIWRNEMRPKLAAALSTPATPSLDDETVERCIAAVETERLECPTDMIDDKAYEQALNDAVAAIRALKGAAK